MSYFRDYRLTAGENPRQKVQAVIGKPVPGQQYAGTRYVPATANVSKDKICPGPGNMRRFSLTSFDIRPLWLHFFDKPSEPVNLDIPIIKEFLEGAIDANHPSRLRLGANYWDHDFFSKGIAWGVSLTKDTFTDAGSGTNFIVKGNYAG